MGEFKTFLAQCGLGTQVHLPFCVHYMKPADTDLDGYDAKIIFNVIKQLWHNQAKKTYQIEMASYTWLLPFIIKVIKTT